MKKLCTLLFLLFCTPLHAQSVEQYAETAQFSFVKRMFGLSYLTLHTFPDPPRPSGWGMNTSVTLRFVWDTPHMQKAKYFGAYHRTFSQTGVEPYRHLWSGNVFETLSNMFTVPRNTRGVYFRVLITSTVWDNLGRQIAADTWESERFWQETP